MNKPTCLLSEDMGNTHFINAEEDTKNLPEYAKMMAMSRQELLWAAAKYLDIQENMQHDCSGLPVYEGAYWEPHGPHAFESVVEGYIALDCSDSPVILSLHGMHLTVSMSQDQYTRAVGEGILRILALAGKCGFQV